MSIDATALPSELLVAPQPLIGFCGLDTARNAVHKTIWDGFSSNRKADRAAVQYKLLPSNYDFPAVKPKRASYDRYYPKGILKRNWMLKHLHVIPAVVVLFQDMDWNDAQWQEKQTQCIATLQALKNALQERNTRLCLVLLQKSAPLPPSEDALAAEKGASLTTACGINSKMLFILPHIEHLQGCTMRLEAAFLDMAQSYYALMSKRIRAHRDQLTAAHVTLKIRHQFKLGFVAEIRQDLSTALKHYTQSYATLDEIRITDANCLEIKTIAGFLNYKICRLMFKLKVPRDSINHFMSHIEKYKNRVGSKDLIFEHYAWLSTQENVFAELFCEAIKNGLPALQTQHPGMYYNKAAEYMQKRKEAFKQSNPTPSSPMESKQKLNLQNNNITSLFTEYFGIRAVKAGEPQTEQQVNCIIRENEENFNHSAAIINLLSQAMTQFKIYKCLRFRKKLAIDTADEYLESGDHSKALTLYSLMLPDYRQDKWSTIFSDVLSRTLRCSFLSAAINDYVSCSLEVLSLKVNYKSSERIIVLENLWKVLQGEPPLAHNQKVPVLRSAWEENLAKVKSPIHVDLDKLTDLVDMCATFEQIELKHDETICLNLILKLQTDVPLRIRNLYVLITDGANSFKLSAEQFSTCEDMVHLRQSKNEVKAINNYQQFEGNMKLQPGLYYKFLFKTDAEQFLENTQLRVLRFEVLIGTDKLMLLLTKSCLYKRCAFRHYSRTRDLDDNIIINPICYITPTFHLVTQCNLGSEIMLVNEFYPVVTTINNPYNVFLESVTLSINVPPHLKNKVFLATDIAPSKQKLHSNIQIDIGEMAMQTSNIASYFVYSLVEIAITLQQKICYTTGILKPKVNTAIAVNDVTTPTSADDSPETTKVLTANSLSPAVTLPIVSPVELEFIDENSIRKIQDTILSVNCKEEFKFSGHFYTLSRKPLTKVYRGENFLLRAGVEVKTSIELDIIETFFICDHNLVQSTYSFKRKKFTNTYRCGENLEDVIVLRTNANADEWLIAKDYERNKSETISTHIFNRLRSSRKHLTRTDTNTTGVTTSVGGNTSIPHFSKCLVGKIPTNMTIIHSNTALNAANTLMMSSQNSNMSTSSTSDDGKTANNNSINTEDANMLPAPMKPLNTRVIYNKTIDALQATGHLRGFIKGTILTDGSQQQQQSQQSQQSQQQLITQSPTLLFGIYCIKWHRCGSKEENETKFIIPGLPIIEPPLNIYCSIEERAYVKMPMTFKITFKNSTAKVIHLIATLIINNSDSFICSGHKQLDVSIFAFSEKELIFNLYPLVVGWHNLPQFVLEYNTQSDPTKDEAQNNLLNELVQRSVPKKVFISPPLKQQNK
uniref:Trafficking protein particle complex subunit 11 n=1 Tax=Glossina palpalis gambiensis TaxID=67801 RepID=A0A1B0BI35_9MUSC